MDDAWTSIAAGRPGKIVQVCYAVPDISSALDSWLERTRAGPFFRMTFDQAGQVFRGEPTRGSLEVALGYLDDLNIEIVEFRGEGPSVYAGNLPGRAWGVHHVQLSTDDLEADLARHAARGEDVVLDNIVPGFGRAVIVDTTPTFGHYVEYGLWTPIVHEMLHRFRAAHLGWDGRDPVRPAVAQ